MRVDVTARHMELTPAIRDHATSKVMRALDGVARIDHAHVIVSVEKHRQQAEVVVQVMHHSLEARDEREDLYAALDGMAEKLSRQVEKLRERVTDHKGPGHGNST